MSKKNIIAVLTAIMIVVACVVSSLAVSEIQNRNIIDKVKVVKRDNGVEKNVPLTLLEKILLYKKYRNRTEVSSENALPSSFVEISEGEKTNIVSVVENEWMELYHLGVLTSPPDGESLKKAKYNIQTCMNAQYDFVTVWQVTIENFGNPYGNAPDFMEMSIERETGKILELQLYKKGAELGERYQYRYPSAEVVESDIIMKWLAECWGEYLEAKSLGANSALLEDAGIEADGGGSWTALYSDGETEVKYQLMISNEEISIWIW